MNVSLANDGVYRSPQNFVHGSYVLTQNLAVRFKNDRDDAMKFLIQGKL